MIKSGVGAGLSTLFYSCGQRAGRACQHAHLATAARVKYPAALQRCNFDAPLPAAGYLTSAGNEVCDCAAWRAAGSGQEGNSNLFLQKK